MSRVIQNLKGLAVGILLLLSLGLAVHQTVIYFRYFEAKEIFHAQASVWFGKNFLEDRLSEGERVFLFGQKDEEWKSVDHEAVLRAFPDDPAVYSRYCSGGWLPDDYRETVDRIDPENGWFDELEAHVVFQRAMKKGKEDEVGRDVLEEAIGLLFRSASKERSESYARKLIQRGVELIPEGDDVQSRLLHHVSGYYDSSEGSSTYFNWRAIREEARFLTESDVAEFRSLVAMSDTLIKRRMESAVDPVDMLVLMAAIEGLRKDFSETARRLGMTKEARVYAEGWTSFRAMREGWKETDEVRQDAINQRSAGHLNMVESGDRFLRNSFDLSELEAGVNAEQAHIAWRNSLQGFHLFGVISIGLGVFLYRGRKEVVGFSSTVKLAICGSLLPLAIFFVLREWTPLGQLQNGASSFMNSYDIGLWFALAFALIVIPLWIAAIFGRRGWKVSGASLLLPAYLCSMIVFGFLSKGFYLAEKEWVAKDRLGAREGIYPTKLDAMIFESLRSKVGGRYDDLVARETEAGMR